ncbi:toxin-antitoxin system YwqK family antitoxin [Planctomycetota bacterium]
MTLNREIKNVECRFWPAHGVCHLLSLLAVFGLVVAATPSLAQEEQDVSAVFDDQSDEDLGLPELSDGFGTETTEDDEAFGNALDEEQAKTADGENPGPSFGPVGREPVIQGDVQELPDAEPIPDLPNDGYSEASLPEQVDLEWITERYPNGNPKIRRQVTQDKDENYINHGSWEMWDENENRIISGAYQFGQRHGKWIRRVSPSDAKFLLAAPYNQYQTEYFTSIATFVAGQLNGKWGIEDDREGDLSRVVSEWNFVNGRRDGKSIWNYPTGDLMREINYHAGELNGNLIEYDDHRVVVTKVEYLNGRRLEKTTKYFSENSEQKQIEGMTLRARLTLKKPDDWWKMELARYTKEGEDEKHGKWTAWYPNGEKRMEGEFQYDQPSGPFVWWHNNGQKSLEAMYSAGKKKGVWTWWHENGMRSIRGAYANGSPTDRWTWWHETGKVSHRIDYTVAGTAHVTNDSAEQGTMLSAPGHATSGLSAPGESILLRNPQN